MKQDRHIDYHEDLIKSLQDTREAHAYLDAARADDDPRIFLLALSAVLEAHRMDTPSFLDRIAIDPKIMVGKPIIKGTRITVELILRLLAQGISIEEIMQEYAHVTREDILACLQFAQEIRVNIQNFVE